MDQFTHDALANWQNFYVICGSSAGALTGLQFVVMTLVMQTRSVRNQRDISAFGTPTIIHFCTALLVSAVMTAPWHSMPALGGCLFAIGIGGFVYSLRVIWHARNAAYQPDLEDRFWYIFLPLLAHLELLGAGILMWSKPTWGLSVAAVDTLLFLILGVHNAWDTVTFLAVKHGNREP